MDPQYIALVAGIIGAIVGAAASVLTVLIQGRYQFKRDLAIEAIRLALEDWKTRIALSQKQGGNEAPLSVYIHYHTRVIDLARRGKITPEEMSKVQAEQE